MSRRGRIVGAALAACCLGPLLTVAPASASASGECSVFETDLASDLQGSTARWTFDSDCRIAEPTPIRLRVLEAGRVIHEQTWEQPNDLGRQWGRVPLAPKPPCAFSDVMVEASYDNRRGLADTSATQTRVYYDPDDSCRA